MNLDRYFTKLYHPRDYNCMHFTRDVIKDFTDTDIMEFVKSVMISDINRKIDKDLAVNAKKLKVETPENFCVAHMRQGILPPHVGVYINGKILHITHYGVQYVEPEAARIGYLDMRYYKCHQ